jgi:hypothetical protein
LVYKTPNEKAIIAIQTIKPMVMGGNFLLNSSGDKTIYLSFRLI